jgi:hypothetical protein
MVNESDIVTVNLSQQEVDDVKEWVNAVHALGFESEFEVIGDPNGEYNVGRKRYLTEEERESVKNYIKAAHTFKRKGEEERLE